MKKRILAAFLLAGSASFAQHAVKVTKDVTFGTNVDILKNLDMFTEAAANLQQAAMESAQLKGAVAAGTSIDAKFYNPADTTTILKVSDIKMDIYEPANGFGAERPLVIYLHTGNFLPPQINGSLAGDKTDSSAVEICKRYAQRGFVAASINYRLGWDPLANDPVTGAITRRATLLNAVYRAIHDTKKAIRFFREDVAAGNTYSIDTSRITLFGEGSGSYVVLATATLDKVEETEIPKFVFPGSGDSSYIQPAFVGDINGYGGLLNLYPNNGISADFDMTISLGGALADTSWLEAGDVPMVSFHAVRDPFAPFDEGTVIVPTTNEDVVDAQGPNVYIAKANALGNNDAFDTATFSGAFTSVAQAKYGQTYSYFLASQNTITLRNDLDGLFPIVRSLKASRFANEGSPWQWWASGNPAFPNPRPASEARTFIDTIMGYAVPRMMVAQEISAASIGMEENRLTGKISVFPNPAQDFLFIESDDADVELQTAQIRDLNGKAVKLVALENARRIHVADLPKGVYLIEIESDKGSWARKFVKE